MSAPADARESLLRRGLGLKYLTVGWNVVEGVVVPAALLTTVSPQR